LSLLRGRLLLTLRATSYAVSRISMLIRKSTRGTKARRTFAALLGMLLGASIYFTPAAGADPADASPAGAPLAYLRDARAGASLSVQRSDERALAASAARRGAPLDAPLADLPVRLHHAFGTHLAILSEAALQGDREVLLRNSDAFVRAAIPVTLGTERRGFVYVDMGAADSALKWQGLAGIHGGRDVDLVGGWRHVTYHFSPGRGFDSIDFNGPFLGATLAW